MSVSGAAKFFVWDEGWVEAEELCERGRSCWLLAYQPIGGRLVPWATAGVHRVAAEGHDRPMVEVLLDGKTDLIESPIVCTADTPFVTATGLVAAQDLVLGMHLLPEQVTMEAISAEFAELLEADADLIVVSVTPIDDRPALYDVSDGGNFLCNALAAISCGQGA